MDSKNSSNMALLSSLALDDFPDGGLGEPEGSSDLALGESHVVDHVVDFLVSGLSSCFVHIDYYCIRL